jgi:hypothetical protein
MNFHPTPVELVGAYVILNAAVQSMEAPTTESSPFYTFFYKFMSLLIIDFKSFSAPKVPAVTATQSVSQTSTVSASASQSGVL